MLSGWVLASTPDLTQADKKKKILHSFHSGVSLEGSFPFPDGRA
jgi:hypothetical protein